LRIVPAFVWCVVTLTALPLLAQQVALVSTQSDCSTDEPDTVAVSWSSPCDNGTWLFEPGVGCRMWDWHPDRRDKATWTGTCQSNVKEGPGVALWTEHGQPIDRFEGMYRNGRREGAGRYEWNERDRFEGTYTQDLPNGFGTVTVNGTALSGVWRNGCLRSGDKTVAIGVPLASCTVEPDYAAETAELPDQATLK